MTHHQHGEGLIEDMPRLVGMRRRMLLRLALGAMTAACGDAGGDDGGSGESGESGDGEGSTPTGGGECSPIPEETAGPYPGDGSNGANALVLAGIVRSDIRASVDGASGTAEGVPLTVTLTIVDEQCAPLSGYAVYIWHCDRDGAYSMYSGSAQDENYLRGVQVTDGDGKVTFRSIFPGAYSGRWPHIHFEVYPTLASATAAGNKLRTSQLALPEAACSEAYTADGYEASVQNLAASSLESDNVFSDGATLQLAAVDGSVDAGYTATLTVTV
jgi:protocatechuate 3,4-dioxygenase beta subunit